VGLLMNAENLARIDAMCREVSALADALNAMHHELTEMRDAMRTSLEPRQTPIALKDAA